MISHGSIVMHDQLLQHCDACSVSAAFSCVLNYSDIVTSAEHNHYPAWPNVLALYCMLLQHIRPLFQAIQDAGCRMTTFVCLLDPCAIAAFIA